MMTKQTFVLFCLPACWVAWRESRAATGHAIRGLGSVLLGAFGVTLPFAGFLGWFAVSGEAAKPSLPASSFIH
ncbi:MAG: hypothetical protein MZW92_21300 [Comamonadaceae bacterium]|nr:hypothetical protein [Comamonadaceae bacterium]